jgi:cell division protein ZapE
LNHNTTQPVTAAYERLVDEGTIERDEHQLRIAGCLDTLSATIASEQQASATGIFGRLFGARDASASVKGIYIWGSVGRGKTMLMDIFFENAQVTNKRRVHFHAFMVEVHAAIHDWRQRKKSGEAKGEDPIAPVAVRLAGEARLLCFDEFSVTDIADAMILGRLFTTLFAQGVIVVATSNVEPSQLYANGLNRALFLPFVRLLLEKVDVVQLDARTDFRLEKLSGSPVYLVPADATSQAALDRLFEKMTGHTKGLPTSLSVLGRQVLIPQARNHVARFSFADLCEQPLAAADYLAIAEQFHTIFIDNIPVMEIHQRNEAKRFINLIDTLYDENVKLIASAHAQPHQLYRADEGKEAFEFERAASRLVEMQSTEYLALPHGRGQTPVLIGGGDTAES